MVIREDTERHPGITERIKDAIGALSPVEQKVARFFLEHREKVLLGSAAEIADQVGTSDATVVRSAQSLGFAGLADLRKALLSDLTGAPSPGQRLKRTLDETGDDTARVLSHVIGLHEEAVAGLKDADLAAALSQAVDLLCVAERRHVFGIGPSGLMASYAAMQFTRIGLPSHALTASGVGLADQLLLIGKNDAVLMFAYAPLYREVTAVLDRAQELSIPVILVSDSLGPLVSNQVAEVVAVTRGRAEHLAMHGATMVVLEAMIIALAARRRDDALDSLETFSELRGSLDRDWLKRGVRRSRRRTVDHSNGHPPQNV